MALNATVVWRVRAGGNELNGGGYDSAVSGAGTDYSQQDAAQLSSTTGACTSTSTTFTDATGTPFTSAMVGNMLAISAGTNALKQHFMITGYTNANTITLDRTPTTGGTITACTYRIGGAKSSPRDVRSAGQGTLPVVTTGLAPGHTVYVRGAGLDAPVSDDYVETTDYYQYPDGDEVSGPIRWFGENGRPRIQYNGIYWYNLSGHYFKNFYGICKVSPGFADYGLICGGGQWCVAEDIVVDVNGQDATGLTISSAFNCEVKNTGGGAASASTSGIKLDTYGAVVGCYVHGVRGYGIFDFVGYLTKIHHNIVAGCGLSGFYCPVTHSTHQYNGELFHNVSYGNGGDGFRCDDAQISIYNNIAVLNGGYGLNAPTAFSIQDAWAAPFQPHNNAFGGGAYVNGSGTTHNLTTYGDIQLAAHPFVDPANGNFSLAVSADGKLCRGAGWPTTLKNLTPVNYVDVGVYQAPATYGAIPNGWSGGVRPRAFAPGLAR